MQSCSLFFINGVRLTFTREGQNKDLKIWSSVTKTAKQTRNIAKVKEGRGVGGLAQCLSFACLIELMILMILSVSGFQSHNLQKKNSPEKKIL